MNVRLRELRGSLGKGRKSIREIMNLIEVNKKSAKEGKGKWKNKETPS